MDNRIDQLINLLKEATNDRLLEWKATSSINEYMVTLKSATYIVSYYSNSYPYYYKFILDNGETQSVLLDSSIITEKEEDLAQLYFVARDSAEKRTVTVDSSIEELQSMLNENLPF